MNTFRSTAAALSLLAAFGAAALTPAFADPDVDVAPAAQAPQDAAPAVQEPAAPVAQQPAPPAAVAPEPVAQQPAAPVQQPVAQRPVAQVSNGSTAAAQSPIAGLFDPSTWLNAARTLLPHGPGHLLD